MKYKIGPRYYHLAKLPYSCFDDQKNETLLSFPNS